MTTPTAKNRTHIASARVGGQSELPSAQRSSYPPDVLQRGIGGLLRGMGMKVQIQPLKEMRLQMGLDMQVVYFTIRIPVAGGVSLRWPVMATLTPKIYSPTRAQHLS